MKKVSFYIFIFTFNNFLTYLFFLFIQSTSNINLIFVCTCNGNSIVWYQQTANLFKLMRSLSRNFNHETNHCKSIFIHLNSFHSSKRLFFIQIHLKSSFLSSKFSVRSMWVRLLLQGRLPHNPRDSTERCSELFLFRLLLG